jgi:hypothetical protein
MDAVIAATITVGWKWLAVLIGLAALLFIEFGVFFGTGSWNPANVVLGEDGKPSTSKFQWFLWLIVVLFAYVLLWVLRARQGDYGAIRDLPTNVLVVLGFSTATAVAAKGIAVGNDKKVAAQAQAAAAQAAVAQAAAAQAQAAALTAPGNAALAAAALVAQTQAAAGVAHVPVAPAAPAVAVPAGRPKGIMVDDSPLALPDIGKIQMVAFTFVTIGIFLATLIHQVATDPVVTTMPDIDSSLLALMGISQAGYLGKKIVSG